MVSVTINSKQQFLGGVRLYQAQDFKIIAGINDGMVRWAREGSNQWNVMAPDDQIEIENGMVIQVVEFTKNEPITPATILADMAKTFEERSAVYQDNYKMVAKIIAILWPNGVPPHLVVQDSWHLFELKIVKLTRFAISNLTHIDSIHDDAVYSAMIESIIRNNIPDSEDYL